jgi:DNA-binding winged helix-turn-helix (wHTH) protein
MSEEDKLAGFEIGADDYITKPFSPRELVVRVEAFLPRSSDQPESLIRFGEVELGTAAMILRVNNQEVPTTSLEFRLLEFLVRSPGLVFTRDRLMEAEWGNTNYENRRSVDVYISKLREKIEVMPDKPQYLLTARGSGYKFVLPSQKLSGRLVAAKRSYNYEVVLSQCFGFPALGQFRNPLQQGIRLLWHHVARGCPEPLWIKVDRYAF